MARMNAQAMQAEHEEEKKGAWHVNGKFRPLRELEIDN